MICGFAKKQLTINKHKFDIFSEQLAEVIARAKGGAENPSELFGGNFGVHVIRWPLFFFPYFFLLSLSARSCQIPNPHRNFSPENKNIDALIF